MTALKLFSQSVLSTSVGMVLALFTTFAIAKEASPSGTSKSDTESHSYANAGVVMSDAAFDKRVTKFRDDVLNGRKSEVAAAIAYPARANVGKQKFALHSSADLMRYYDKIFSLKMIRAIRAAETQNLFSRDQGVMLGDGEVWFNNQAKVITLNN